MGGDGGRPQNGMNADHRAQLEDLQAQVSHWSDVSSVPHWSAVSAGFSLVGSLSCLFPHWSAVLAVWILYGWLSQRDVWVFLCRLPECLVPQWSAVWVPGSSMVGCLSVWFLNGQMSVSDSSLVGCLSVWFLIDRMSLSVWSSVVGCLSVWLLIGRLSWEFGSWMVGSVWVSASSLVGCLECLVPHWQAVQSQVSVATRCLNIF